LNRLENSSDPGDPVARPKMGIKKYIFHFWLHLRTAAYNYLHLPGEELGPECESERTDVRCDN